MAVVYKQLDLVWAKLLGCPPWPGQIASEDEPALKKAKPENENERLYPVVFFGSKDPEWIPVSNLWPYELHKKNMKKGKGRGKDFRAACELAEKQAQLNVENAANQNADPNTLESPSAEMKKVLEDDNITTTPKSFSGAEESMDVTTAAANDNDSDACLPKFKFGFLGMGRMGHALAKNLLIRGKYPVVIWNRTPEKCKDLVAAGAEQGDSPADVISKTDILFSCVSTVGAAKEIFYAKNGILQSLSPQVRYVQMSGIDLATSNEFEAVINCTGGHYLEAQLFGTPENANDGSIQIMCSGDQTLFKDCDSSAFRILSNKAVFLDYEQPGSAIALKLVFQIIRGAIERGISESIGLAHSSGVNMNVLLHVAGLSSLASECLMQNLANLATPQLPAPCDPSVRSLQKDLQNAIMMAHQNLLPMQMTAMVNESLVSILRENPPKAERKVKDNLKSKSRRAP